MSGHRFRLGRALAFLVTGPAIVVVALGPFYGRFLAAEDPLERADAIFVLGGGLADRTLEAAELYQAGYAPRIVLSDTPRDGGTLELERRGLHVLGDVERARDILLRLGIRQDAIIVPHRHHDSTGEEALTLRDLSVSHRWTSVVVVTSPLHLRRAGFAIRRQLADLGVRVVMRGSRYARSDPEHWWRRRGDARETLFELQKLVFYWVGLGG